MLSFPLPRGRNSHRIPRNKRHLYSATGFLEPSSFQNPQAEKEREKISLSKLFFSVFISPSSSLLFLSAAFEEYGTHEKRASHKPRGGRGGEKRELVWTITITLYDERRTDWKHRKKERGKSWEKEMRRRIFRAKFLPRRQCQNSAVEEAAENERATKIIFFVAVALLACNQHEKAE